MSTPELVDAAVAAAQPGVLHDRATLRAALTVTLVKERRDLEVFDRVFDAFFGLQRVLAGEDGGHGHAHDDLSDEEDVEQFTLSEEPSQSPQQGHSHGKPADIRDFFDREDLAEQYNRHQEADKLDLASMTDEVVLSTDQESTADQAARVQLSTERFAHDGPPGDLATDPGPSVDVALTAGQEQALLDWLEAAGEDGGDVDPDELAELRRRLGGLLSDLPERLREYLQRLVELEDRQVETRDVTTSQRRRVDEQERAALEEALRRVVRSLHGAPRPRRRESAHGRISGGRTMRANMRYDGVPFRPVTVSRVEDRPRLVVLADVSLSVRASTAFTLQLVHGLQSHVRAVRSFAFVADVVEITDLFAEHQAEEALGLVVAGLPAGGVLDVDADSDYGSVFTAFLDEHGPALTRQSTLLVLGDGRGNSREPGLVAFEEMTRRVRETVWLTPEPRYSWGLGSCDLPRYAELCDRVQVVQDLSGLERVSLQASGARA
ncbi:VWA domain-containing protein [Aquipuribacter sp. MA13-6]|uniref:VWA domain-containing protein n=1 Tax=unclassified Aquipuribacter TaxID=2635084 RepID=UPI003EED8F82